MNKQNSLYKILCCPNCKTNLSQNKNKLTCKKCSKSYSIIKGIPVFISDISEEQLKNQQKIFNSEYSNLSSYTIHNWQKSFINRILNSFEIVKPTKNSYYMDVGAGGAGYTVIEMAKKGIKSVGCDLSLTGMLKAKEFAKQQKVADKTLFLVCDAQNLPIKDNLFNYISCIMLLEHLKEDQKAVKEMSRIAKSKARIFISVPNTYLRMWPFLWPLYMFWDKKLGHVRHYSEAHLTSLFNKSKLKTKEVFYTVHLIKFIQMALYMILPVAYKDRIWWKLEKIDFLQTKEKSGLNLNAIFEKK